MRKTSSKVRSSNRIDPQDNSLTVNCNGGHKYASEFLDFMNSNPTVFHAAQAFATYLAEHGFVELYETEPWESKIDPAAPGKYFVIRNGSAILAFVIGNSWKPGNGIGLVGCHLDANTARLKPISKKPTKDGFKLLAVAPYGDGLGPTWWDRDLGLGGRIIVQTSKGLESRLVLLDHPIGRIPTLAPHFGAPSVGPFDKESQMIPIFGLDPREDERSEEIDGPQVNTIRNSHDPRLLSAIATNANVSVDDILQLELELFDSQPGTFGGLDKEFLFCPRLDDKLCCFAAVRGLVESAENPLNQSTDNIINMIAFFDDEEVGSLLRQGAKGGLVQSVVSAVSSLYGDSNPDTLQQTYANSFFVSSDVTHAVNPNFSEVYLENHKPKLNCGMVVKEDPNAHTTSDGISVAFIQEIARQSDNVIQHFHIRNGTRSGGTIGPALSAATGMRAVDLGIPQLSMHSIRATTGSDDVYLGVKMFRAFFNLWKQTDDNFAAGGL